MNFKTNFTDRYCLELNNVTGAMGPAMGKVGTIFNNSTRDEVGDCQFLWKRIC